MVQRRHTQVANQNLPDSFPPRGCGLKRRLAANLPYFIGKIINFTEFGITLESETEMCSLVPALQDGKLLMINYFNLPEMSIVWCKNFDQQPKLSCTGANS